MADSGNKHESTQDSGGNKIALVYAKALLGAAENAGETADVIGQFDAIVREVLDPNPRFEEILGSGMIAEDAKASMLKKLFEGKVARSLLHFLLVVASHQRLDLIREIQQALEKLHDELRGRIDIQVSTPQPLSDTITSSLVTKLQAMLGGQPKITSRVEPDLIGGVVFRVGDTIYDGSIRTQLEKIRTDMIDRSIHEIQSRRDRFSSAS